MNSKLVSNIEFFGGPEDGLELSGEDTLRFLEAAGPHAHEEIPMFVRDQTPGRMEGRLILIGFYVVTAKRGDTMCYQWIT
ncbi:hypothetical protein [Haloferula sp. BvORR071]|uniref:hypothetical protein n=1 Tax=Haloferula sp. BvORR071 TaxID=1396141 RepID=UPI0005587332|nr:hypothetical protein [Haloferula sp. BvORR071]